MKITSGTFNLKVDLKEKEEKVLAEVLEIVTKAMKESTASPVVDTTAFVEQLKASAVEAVSRITPTVEKVEEPICVAPAAKVEENNEDVPRRFMIGQCKCGETHFLFVYDNGKTFEFKCRRCGLDHAVDYHELEHAQTECVCGQISTFFVAPNSTLKRTECKKCGALNAVKPGKKKALVCK